VAQARRGIESASPALIARPLDGFTYWATSWDTPVRLPPATFLLPNYDEYVIAYKDRHLVRPPAKVGADGIMKGADAFAHPLIVDGVLAGLWRRRVSGAKTAVEIVPKVPLTAPQRRALRAAADRLAAFSGPGLTLVGRV
jgi:hypothetical protein